MRKELKVGAGTDHIVDATGRDAAKTFLLTEMGAVQSEDWGIRALGVMFKAGLVLPDAAVGSGMAVWATYGLRAMLAGPYSETKPLLDELMACVQIVEPAATRRLTDDDIEEARTRLALKDEVLRLHVGFSIRENLLGLALEAMNRVLTSGSTPTSDQSAEPSSRPVRRRSRNSAKTTGSPTPI